MSTGRLISFEGLDGAGKTTQLSLLEDWLARQRVPYLRTREPGGTPLGTEIRQLLLNRPEITITPLAEAFLFQADRAQHFATLILPALAAGKLVITDRCLDSSVAYQGSVRSVGMDLVEHLSLLATQGRVPDLTILLDLDPTEVQTRTESSQDRQDMQHQREQPNRFDRESEHFHRRLRQAFLEIARRHPGRIHVVDASRSPQQIHAEIVSLIKPWLPVLSS